MPGRTRLGALVVLAATVATVMVLILAYISLIAAGKTPPFLGVSNSEAPFPTVSPPPNNWVDADGTTMLSASFGSPPDGPDPDRLDNLGPRRDGVKVVEAKPVEIPTAGGAYRSVVTGRPAGDAVEFYIWVLGCTESWHSQSSHRTRWPTISRQRWLPEPSGNRPTDEAAESLARMPRNLLGHGNPPSVRDETKKYGYGSGSGRLAWSIRSRSSGSIDQPAAPRLSSSCWRLRAPMIGAVTAGWSSNQFSATCAGVRPVVPATAWSASRTVQACSLA